MPLGNFPHILQNGPGNTPDADQVMANWQHIRTYLNSTGWLAGSELANNAVTTSKIADAAITSAKIGVNQITGFHILSGTIGGGHIQPSAITGFHILDATIGGGHIQPGAVTAAKIANNAVTSAKANLTVQSVSQSSDHTLSTGLTNISGLGLTLEAGTWLCMGHASLNQTQPGGADSEIRLALNGTSFGTSARIRTGIETRIIPASVFAHINVGSTSSLALRGRSMVGQHTALTANGRLLALRVG